MIDWEKVNELKTDLGSEDFDEIVEVFLSEVEEELAALPERPASEHAGSFHLLKGCALNLGFSTFASLCHDREIEARQSLVEDTYITEIQKCYAASKAAFLEGTTNE